MKALLTTLLLSCSFLCAQENKDALVKELNDLTREITARYHSKEYKNIDSLNLMRDQIINQLSLQGYEPEGEALLIEMDYAIARLGRIASENNFVIHQLRQKRKQLARELNQPEHKP